MAIFHKLEMTLEVLHSPMRKDVYELTCFYEDPSHFHIDHIEIDAADMVCGDVALPLKLTVDDPAIAKSFARNLLEEERETIEEVCEEMLREPAFMAGGDW